MNIDAVHRLVVDARKLENETATAAETLAPSAAADQRRALEDIAHGARIRQLLWDSRLPDTAYIGTGRADTIATSSELDVPPSDTTGLTAHLERLHELYDRALSGVNAALDPLTHRLLTRGIAETAAGLAELTD